MLRTISISAMQLGLCAGLSWLGLTLECSAEQTRKAPGIVDIYAARDGKETLAGYREPTTNLEFNYPKLWTAKQNPDKDSLLKIAGTTSDARYGEIKISVLNGVHDASVAKALMESELSRSVPGFQKVQERKIRFGNRYQYSGDELSVNFNTAETPINDRLVFFIDGQQVCLFSFISKTSESSLVQPLFDQVLASCHHKGAAAFTHTSQTSPAQQTWKLVTYNEKGGNISVGYPEGWRFVNNDPGKELDVKFAGKNAAGMDAELFVSKIQRDPATSIDQFTDMFEQTYLKPLKDFRKEAKHQATFGISHNEGNVQYCTFTVEGTAARHAGAFFGDSRHYYCVALNSVGWTERETRDLFDRVLATVKVSD